MNAEAPNCADCGTVHGVHFWENGNGFGAWLCWTCGGARWRKQVGG